MKRAKLIIDEVEGLSEEALERENEELEESAEENSTGNNATKSATGEENSDVILPFLPEVEEGLFGGRDVTILPQTKPEPPMTLCRQLNCKFEGGSCL